MKNRIKKSIVWFLNFRKCCNYKNVKIMKQTRLDERFEFCVSKDSNVCLGRDLKVKKNVSIRVRKGANLVIGDRVYFNNNCLLTCRYKVVIGNDVSFGPNVVIFDHDHDYRSSNRKQEFLCDNIIIGEHTWIGANVCILKGSVIGKNCVIAAGSVVKGHIDDDCIYYGKDKIKKIRR